VPLAAVLDVGGFSLSRATGLDPQFLEPTYPFEWAGVYALPAGEHTLAIGHCDHDHAHGEHEHGHEHGEGHAHPHHDHAENELDVVILPVAALDETVLSAATETAARAFAEWENKVAANEPVGTGPTLQRLLLQNGHAHFPLKLGAAGHYMVFEGCGEHPLHIEVNGENSRPVWQRDFLHRHSHDDDVTSVGLSLPGEVDGKRLNDWISALLKNKGNDLYRSKGVLAVRGSAQRLVFQGVHMLFDARFDRDWRTDETRQNTLVFIGKNLDRAALTAGFKACLVG
jgi:hypothetical protein